MTVDIDPSAALGARGPKRHLHITADALDERLPDLLPGAGFDITLCNPPYDVPQWRPGFERILSEAGLADAVVPAQASAEVLFVAQNLRLARPGGRLGLLVPDGLMTGRRSAPFRAALLRDHRVETVVQLPQSAFLRTEARAFVLVLTKGRPSRHPVALRKIGLEGLISAPCMVSPLAAAHRLDHDFHAAAGVGRGPSLRDFNAKLVRGSVKVPARAAVPFFHTTHFPRGDARYAHDLPRWEGPADSRLVCAEPGDILIARVDRNLQRKVCGVATGRIPLTSSVLRLRVSAPWRNQVLAALLSSEGEARLAATARGVGARMLGCEDLAIMSLPL